MTEEVRVNKSYTFLLPMLGTSIDSFPYVRGVFHKAEDKPQYDGHILLLTPVFEGRRDDYYTAWLKATCFAKYEPDSFHVIYVFEVPELRKPDYYRFVKGEWSKMSKDYKDHVKRFHKCKIRNDYWGLRVMQVLDKDPSYKKELEEMLDEELGDQELASVPDERDTYTNDLKIINSIN